MTTHTAPVPIRSDTTGAAAPSAPAATVHTLKVTLRDVEPEVSRVVQVPSDIALDKLAETLVDTMGWEGDHLHIFTARRTNTKYWSTRWDDGDSGHEDEAQHRLGDILHRPGMKMDWEYDLGDSWHHDIVVMSVTSADSETTLPRCVDGTGACPPEDCGGPWGYTDLLHALNTPTHPRHGEAADLLGASFDPEHFNAAEHADNRADNQRILDALNDLEPFPVSWLE